MFWSDLKSHGVFIFPQTQTSQTLSIPKEHHRFILGKGGERLQKLETDTATKISIPKANEDTDLITITGPKDGIELAILRINDVSMEQGSKVTYNPQTLLFSQPIAMMKQNLYNFRSSDI